MARFEKVFVDKQKAKSIFKMAETTFEMIKTLDKNKFASNVMKEYYDVLREFMGTLLLLDGYKIAGEEAHKELIEYIGKTYKEFNALEILLLDEMRIIRNKIAYDGFFIDRDYLERKLDKIALIMDKLKKIINKKLSDQ